MKKLLIATLLILVAVSERLWFDLGANVELVMTVSVIASIYLGRKWGVMVAVLALMISDLVIGNTAILIFTWSAFGLIAAGGGWLKQWQGMKRSLAGAGYGLLGALWFYFYTNFGVWLIGGLYPHTWQGLVGCYWMGLPFLKLHAVSSMILIGGGVELAAVIRNKDWQKRISYLTTK